VAVERVDEDEPAARIERGWAPTAAADRARQDRQLGVPERTEEAADRRTRNRRATLRAGRLSDRVRLGGGGGLTCSLRTRSLRHSRQRLPVAAIENVTPAGFAALVDTLATGRVEQDHRAQRTVVPDIVVDLLEVPAILTGFGVQRHDGIGEQ